uniref:(California timema) hypothetical protein n=1 Tax=Timema californicum TaxID=61474 RepID=A0A7R9JJ05_TIMCA|nr:unnamed protein product [Timema californicum]
MALNESNIWNDIANLTTSTIPLIPAQFSCADKQDGLYSDPTAHNRYYKCSGGLHELHTCKDHLHYSHESQSCGRSVCHAQENGLYANYSLDCHEYYRCENQRLAESFICGPDDTFSAAERLCLPSGEVVCVEPHCDYNSSGYFVLPATRCQAYYSCEHGTAIHHLCPYNSVFDVDRQVRLDLD